MDGFGPVTATLSSLSGAPQDPVDPIYAPIRAAAAGEQADLDRLAIAVAAAIESTGIDALEDRYFKAWMSDTSVFIRDLSTGLTAEQSGRFHSNQSLAISGSLVCFESLNEEDIDIFCSNGFHLQRPGHQRNPSIWKDWLVFHEGDQALLYGPIK